jgi:hypothetical protein
LAAPSCKTFKPPAANAAPLRFGARHKQVIAGSLGLISDNALEDQVLVLAED